MSKAYPEPQTGNRSTRLAEAAALLARGRDREAEQLCQSLLLNRPGDPPAQHLLAMIAVRRGRPDLAAAHMRIACRAPGVPPAYFSTLADLLRRAGQLAEGEAAARRAVKLDEGHAAGWNNLGIILQEMGQLQEGLSCLQRALALTRGNAAAHNNIANTLIRLGDHAGAERYWQQALDLKPGYAEVLSNLANLHKLQGRYDTALDFARRALRLDSRLPDAYINLAAIEMERWQYAAAHRVLDRLLSFAPNHVPALVAMVSVLMRLERNEEALRTAAKAVQLQPGNADALDAQARALLAVGRFEEAMASFDAAIALPSASMERIMVFRAAALLEHGKADLAREGFAEVLRRFPGSPSALQNLARIHRFSPGDPLIADMRSALKRTGGTSRGDQISLHFGLGKAMMDLGEDAEAFRHFNKGNRMKRALVNYDSASTRAWMRSLSRAFSPELMRRFAGQGFASRVPVFVLGMPRSGTSLIEQILASHPDVHGAGELKLLSSLVTRLGGLPDAVPRFTPQLLRTVGSDYVAGVTPLARGKPLVVDKMPSNFLQAGFINLILPQARIIHARRNAADTCLSCYTSLFGDALGFTYDLRELGAFHRGYQELMAHWAKVLPKEQFLEVDYEAVVEDTEGQARRMLDFLGLPWTDSVLEFHLTARPVRTASVAQVRQPIYRSSAGKWRKYAAHLGPLLAALETA